MANTKHIPGPRKLRKFGGQEMVELADYSAKHSKFLGTNKAGEEYELSIANSMTRYMNVRARRQNLFAFVMPAGHGKTYLAERYGFVDVDLLITLEEHDYFVAKRVAIMNGFDTWRGHNSEWFSRMNQTLDLLDYSRPVIIMVQHEEIALELGAQVLAALRLCRSAFEDNIRHRDKVSKHFSMMNYDTFTLTKGVENIYDQVASREGIEDIVLAVMNACGLAVACPYKYSRRYRNPHYADTVPGWVLRGERDGDDRVNIRELVSMFDDGMIPRECVDYYVRRGYTTTSFDFGVSMFEWSKLMAEIPPCIRDRQKLDDAGDMLKIFPPRGGKEMGRANVTMRRLIQTFDILSHEDVRDIASRHIGEPQVFVASILSAWKGIVQDTSVSELVMPWFGIGFRHWAKKMKSLHAYVRTSRFFMNTEITEKDRQGLMYMDLLVGRAEYSINEMSEVEARASDSYETKHLSYDPDARVFTNGQYKKDFSNAMSMAYSRIRCSPRKINVNSFMDFYMRRKTWLTKGSLVYNKLGSQDKKFTAHVLDAVANTVIEVQGRHNKQSLFEVADLEAVFKDVTEDNFNLTKTMIKYEVGDKFRTLLPGTLAHFIIFTYILILAEKQEQVGSVRLNAMADEDIKYFDKKMGTGIYHALYDWADFNEQHSADEMAAVIESLGSSIAGPSDYSMFVEAIAAGMYSMGLEDRAGKRWKIWKGLYSGWRGTTWTNTVLNFCYVFIGLENYKRIYREDVTIMVDHGGDDIDLMLSEPAGLGRFLSLMDSMLFNANHWKQMFGVRSEFFRNTISGTTVYASPTRALASFAAGDWEGTGQATVRERVVSLLDQIGKMRRRGVSDEMCQGFTMSTIGHWCKIKDGDEWLNLPPVIIHGHPDNNGLGIPDRDNQVWRLSKDVPEISDEWYKVIVPDYKASRDYVKVLADDLSRFELTIARSEDLARKMASDSFDIDKAIDYTAWTHLLKFNAEVIEKVDIVEARRDDLLFEGFMELVVTDEMDRKYTRASRYQEYTPYLSLNGMAISKEDLIFLMSGGEVCLEAIEFSGDIYYRRLVPDFMALRITIYCREAINRGVCSPESASEVFKTLCYMAKEVFGHRM